ncbi:uncharacterized protein BO97DRAFT_200835 [Aspergillus homomorphus CBS 101889]|uniref:Secreted protein n=1 Tax=Aspergillus homomorphus (strain CBS 101889) TaxID=1450537 RepID=A0A395HKW0_ASPHC|nr:hypothetical protein BO97DRAFT_200835 [Aspergillus homomorphus CBS 101889]RAL08591.1 hypothetical protein BO97DRAFT_200835 [Aspergillus homomorphus CBS 101889]
MTRLGVCLLADVWWLWASVARSYPRKSGWFFFPSLESNLPLSQGIVTCATRHQQRDARKLSHQTKSRFMVEQLLLQVRSAFGQWDLSFQAVRVKRDRPRTLDGPIPCLYRARSLFFFRGPSHGKWGRRYGESTEPIRPKSRLELSVAGSCKN